MSKKGLAQLKKDFKENRNKGLEEHPYYQHLGLSCDPFTPDFPYINEEAVVVTKPLRNCVISAAKHLRSQKNMLIVGPELSGKTLFLKAQEQVLLDTDIFPLYVDAAQDWKPSSSTSEEESPLKNFHNWVAESQKLPYDIEAILIDNMGAILFDNDFFYSIFHELENWDNNLFIIASLSLCERDYLQNAPYFNYKEFSAQFYSPPVDLRPINKIDEIISLLLTRLELAEARYNLFEDSTLHYIAELSCGLPGLACLLASNVLETAAFDDRFPEISTDTLIQTLRFRQFHGLDSTRQLYWGLYYNKRGDSLHPDLVNFASNTLNAPRLTILQEALKFAGQARIFAGKKRRKHFILEHGGVSNSFLQDSALNLSKSTISHHLQTLNRQQQFLQLLERGRNKFYYLPELLIGPIEAAVYLQPQSLVPEMYP